MTFSGSCAFSGRVQFQPPLTTSGQPARDLADAAGTCSGTLGARNGQTHQLSGIPVHYIASDVGSDASCQLSAGATGNGELIFPSGKLPFELTETRIGAVAQLSLTGRHGGSATGTANVTTSANPIQVAEQCAGTGLQQTSVDIDIRTSPSISG